MNTTCKGDNIESLLRVILEEIILIYHVVKTVAS